jgi:hypothetical protein
MTEKSKTTEDPMQSAAAAFAEWQKAGFGPMAWMGTGWITGLGDMSGEVMRFVADRIKEDVKTQHEILHAKDITEVQGIQTRFLRDALDQYAAESGKLIEMGNDLFSKGSDTA